MRTIPPAARYIGGRTRSHACTARIAVLLLITLIGLEASHISPLSLSAAQAAAKQPARPAAKSQKSGASSHAKTRCRAVPAPKPKHKTKAHQPAKGASKPRKSASPKAVAAAALRTRATRAKRSHDHKNAVTPACVIAKHGPRQPAPAHAGSSSSPPAPVSLAPLSPTDSPPTAPAESPYTPETAQVAWNPLAEQSADPDTLFMLDPVAESTYLPGFGGLMDANGNGSPWGSNADIAEVPGKYRTGLESTNRNGGYAWMPFDGWLPTNQFTVEFWLDSPTTPWSQIGDNTPLAFNETYSDGIWVNINAGWLQLKFIHEQSASGTVSTIVRYNVSSLPANQWENFAFTYNNGTLDLYANGALAGTATNVPAPQIWTGAMDIGGADGKGATSLEISDLRISRTARVPGQTTTVSNANNVSANPSAPTGQTVNQGLLGGLHTLGGPATEAMSHGVLTGMRTDKLLTATPMVAGAPDATHPTQGISGAFSYDWQVVDRTFAYYARLGLTPYISIDSTPQILGGSVAPFSGTALTTERSYQSGFSNQVPDNLTEWSDMVKDLVYHVTVEDHYSVPYWGVWNEPDGPDFWSGSLSDYLALYQATVTAVKSVNPNLLVGGPETSSWNPTWIQGLINYCATNHLPLDFISWHYYSGDLGEMAKAQAQVAQWAQAAGIPTPKLVIGEWAGNAYELPGIGNQPWASTNVFLNDSHATFVAESLMLMQADGIAKAFYTNPVAEATGTGWNGTGLMSSTEPWSNLNVFRMWSMLEPNIVSATYTGQPGVLAQASTGANGAVTVLLAYNRYRKDVTAPTAVNLPASYAGWTVEDYVMDDQHSDAWDAGPAHANLEQLPESSVDASGTAHTNLRPDSVHLLVITPPNS